MAYTIIENQLGQFPIAKIDAGYLPPSSVSSGSTTVYPTPPLTPGMIVRANDPTYGEGEFILLLGVASTAVGSLVTYSNSTYQTALAPAGTNLPQAVAVAMSANTGAEWGWYQISGLAVCAKATGALTAGVAAGISTAGNIVASSTGAELQGALIAGSVTSAVLFVPVMINRPHMQGRIT